MDLALCFLHHLIFFVFMTYVGGERTDAERLWSIRLCIGPRHCRDSGRSESSVRYVWTNLSFPVLFWVKSTACGLVTRPYMSCCGHQVEPKGLILVETAGFSTVLSCLTLDPWMSLFTDGISELIQVWQKHFGRVIYPKPPFSSLLCGAQTSHP